MNLSFNLKIFFACMVLVVFVSCLINKDLKPIHIEETEISLDVHEHYATKSPVHIHLDDGGLVVALSGFILFSENGKRYIKTKGDASIYDLYRNKKSLERALDYDEVEFIEVVNREIDALAAILNLPPVLSGSLIAAFAIFGSCPTVYSLDCGEASLEAETFSYSIARRFEMEDVDKLEFASIHDGILKLQLRNEAYETHYLNTFKVLAATHNTNESVFPTESDNILDWKKELIQVGEFIPLNSVTDKFGNDISSVLLEEDGIYHSTPQITLDKIPESGDQMDWFEIEINVPPDQNQLFLALKMRSTLLNTVLLYDLFLADQNFASIDWISNKANQLFYAFQFARWYRKNFGMHIEVWKDGAFQEVKQIGDSGPISWSKLAVELPVESGGKQKIRLRSVADNWHIDWMGVSFEGSHKVDFKVLEIADFTSNTKNTQVQNNLKTDDEQYLITYPGHSYEFDFLVEELSSDKAQSLFVQSKGYYIEWLRKDWLLPKGKEKYQQTLKLEDALLVKLYKEWNCQKATMEDYFFKTMVAVDHKHSE